MNNVLTYKGFIGSVNYSSEDHIFFGKIEGISDLVTFRDPLLPNWKMLFVTW